MSCDIRELCEFPAMTTPFTDSAAAYVAAPNGCPAYFDAGKTPDTVWLIFQGIERGPDWTPGQPEPPNGIYEAVHTPGTCIWNYNAGATFGFFQPHPITAHVEFVAAGTAAFQSAPAIDLYTYANQLPFPPPLGILGGGTCYVLNILADTAPTAFDILDLIRIPPSDDAAIGASSIDAAQVVLNLLRRSDATKLHVKFDYT